MEFGLQTILKNVTKVMNTKTKYYSILECEKRSQGLKSRENTVFQSFEAWSRKLENAIEPQHPAVCQEQSKGKEYTSGVRDTLFTKNIGLRCICYSNFIGPAKRPRFVYLIMELK